eukprot:gnl/TRDRNA2_/TRDRNA2_161489_c1_seq1.p1 gnl/TRDRNA2_/TRDRNA2_161489_c1~~gnl/TRDRNA2_/TRDRNA2_161489_c1_seq1.p1  ORF type:complete len:328 (+),score=109.66 gnl/TRDRNA2_/TRDRNA2_161489_c1_seq1:27-986(+)
MSAAERRRQKKGGSADPATVQDDADAGTGGASSFKPPPRAAAAAGGGAAAAAGAPKPLPRGQRNKQKKIRDKYSEQDDEERELRLALLGSKASKHLQGAAAISAAEGNGTGSSATAAEAKAATAPVTAAAAVGAAGKADAAAKAKGVKAAKAEAKGHAKANRTGEHEGGKGKGKGAASTGTVRLIAGCDADGALDQQLEQLDILTGQPHTEDEVLYMLPMVAPYCALSGPYAYRIKLTPGTMKKGQAARTGLKMFEAQLALPAWKQLIQTIPEQETAGLLCGTCKLSMPGMQKLQQQLKRDKQKDSKDQGRVAKKAGAA